RYRWAPLNKTPDIVLHLQRNARGLESLILGGIDLVLYLILCLILRTAGETPDKPQEDYKMKS
ncbi:MAG: hypothetical protein RI941_1194, partial [Pseudomonadota bacterium]